MSAALAPFRLIVTSNVYIGMLAVGAKVGAAEVGANVVGCIDGAALVGANVGVALVGSNVGKAVVGATVGCGEIVGWETKAPLLVLLWLDLLLE